LNEAPSITQWSENTLHDSAVVPPAAVAPADVSHEKPLEVFRRQRSVCGVLAMFVPLQALWTTKSLAPLEGSVTVADALSPSLPAKLVKVVAWSTPLAEMAPLWMVRRLPTLPTNWSTTLFVPLAG
jgi:hypothetical protein